MTIRPRRLAGCALAAAVLTLAAPVALAHQGNPNYRSVVTSLTPKVEGIDARILNFDDAILLRNTSGKDVTVFDYANPPKPYARLLADGSVSVNVNSEAYYLNEDRLGQTAVPKNLPSEPQWKLLSRSSRFEWHDHRMHWMGSGDPPQLTDKDRRQKLYDWTIPLEVDGQTTTIAGTLSWVPLDGGGLPPGAIIGFGVLLVALAILTLIVRRRRLSRAEAGDTAPREQEVAEAW